MVTGDFALTAQAIAAECGIITNPPNLVKGISALSRDDAFSIATSIDEDSREKAVDTSDHAYNCRSIVLSGPELITLNENQWEQLCKYDEIVFARTTPEQKVLLTIHSPNPITDTSHSSALSMNSKAAMKSSA